MAAGLAVRLWWVFPLVLAVATAVAAMRHREQPLSATQLSPPARAAVERASAGASAPAHGPAVLRTLRTHTMGHDWPMERIEKERLEPIGQGLFRRVLNSQERVGTAEGQRAVVEFRSITWRGLLALRSAERVPAAIYHDVFADEGWIVHTVQSLDLQPEPGFPQREGSRLQARFLRARVDAQALPNEPAQWERRLACRSEGTVPAATVRPGTTGALPRVVCESTSVASGGGARGPEPGRTTSRYVYLADIDYFFLTDWSEEVKNPFRGDGEPPELWAFERRLQNLQVEATPQPSR